MYAGYKTHPHFLAPGSSSTPTRLCLSSVSRSKWSTMNSPSVLNETGWAIQLLNMMLRA